MRGSDWRARQGIGTRRAPLRYESGAERAPSGQWPAACGRPDRMAAISFCLICQSFSVSDT